MSRMYYRYYNANPKGKLTDDCFIRSICAGEGRSWEDVFMDLVKMSIKEGYVPGDERLYSKYLIANGWVKQKRPVKANGKLYTIKEFLEVSNFKGHSITNAGSCHLTYLDDGYVYDIFDCTERIMNCWWTPRSEEKEVMKAWKNLKSR